MNRKYYEYESSSDDEGFHQAQIKIIDNIPPPQIIMETIKLGDARQIQAKIIKPIYFCNTILINTNFISYPQFLYQPLEDPSVKMNKKKELQVVQPKQLKQLGQFLKTGNFICKYNKFESKLDYRPDMTCYYKSFQQLSQPFNSFKQLSGKDFPSKQDIQFSSNFQCGNLQFVFGSDNTFYLLLQNDINTKGYNQWFYFRIKNKRKCKVKLIILNISKITDLLKNAMGISIFSMQQRSFCKKYWTQGGTNIKLFKNGFKKKTKNNNNTQYYSLEFDYDFKFQSDTVYFALNTPFTYTKLLSVFDDILRPIRQKILINVKQLGKTISNNSIHVVIFSINGKTSRGNFVRKRSISNQTNYSKAMLTQSLPPELPKKRNSIIFIGRQHPCQTNSSVMLDGIMSFLSQQSDASLYLLEQYDIYIIPMVNPDGVIHGHTRTNLSGYDLNRLWDEQNPQKSKQVSLIMNYLKYLNETTLIKYAFDFHSHSKKLNTFGYFCEDSVQTRAFAWYIEDTNMNFQYSSCTFGKNKNKQKTFRYFAYNELGVRNSITIETSFFGRLQHGLFRRYTAKQVHEIGVSIMKAIGQFSEVGVANVITNNFIQSNVEDNKVVQQLSDSDPEQDYLDQRQRVKIILDARREKQSLIPKGAIKNVKKSTNLLNKSLFDIDRQKKKAVTLTAKAHTSPDRPFKPYSQQQILKDDSFVQDTLLSKRKNQNQMRRTHTRFYMWDEDKYNVNKLISYPTSLIPYLKPLNSKQTKSLQQSPLKKRKQNNHRYSQTTQIQLERLITESKKRQQQKYQYISYEESKNKFKLGKRQNRRLLSHVLTVSSMKQFNYK